MAFWLNCFYIVVLSWAMYYIYASLAYDDLPWRNCNHEWNTPVCKSEYEIADDYNECAKTALRPDVQCYINTTGLKSPVTEFWEHNVLQITSGLHEMGDLRRPLAITLAIAWVACYFCIWKGVKWTGKVSGHPTLSHCQHSSSTLSPTQVVYFTALFPYVLLIVLLIRGLTLDGAADGIAYYLSPKMDRLADSGVSITGHSCSLMKVSHLFSCCSQLSPLISPNILCLCPFLCDLRWRSLRCFLSRSTRFLHRTPLGTIAKLTLQSLFLISLTTFALLFSRSHFSLHLLTSVCGYLRHDHRALFCLCYDSNHTSLMLV